MGKVQNSFVHAAYILLQHKVDLCLNGLIQKQIITVDLDRKVKSEQHEENSSDTWCCTTCAGDWR